MVVKVKYEMCPQNTLDLYDVAAWLIIKGSAIISTNLTYSHLLNTPEKI